MNKMSKVKNIKTLSKNKYLSLYSADYTNKKGNLKNWIIASRKSLEDIENLAKEFKNKIAKIRG